MLHLIIYFYLIAHVGESEIGSNNGYCESLTNEHISLATYLNDMHHNNNASY